MMPKSKFPSDERWAAYEVEVILAELHRFYAPKEMMFVGTWIRKVGISKDQPENPVFRAMDLIYHVNNDPKKLILARVHLLDLSKGGGTKGSGWLGSSVGLRTPDDKWVFYREIDPLFGQKEDHEKGIYPYKVLGMINYWS